MKTKPPYKIWVYHRKDGVTTFGEYINGKRRVFFEGRLEDEATANTLIDYILGWNMRNAMNPRQLSFAGDELPPEFMDKLRMYSNTL
jgi:hypothetical protein